MQVTLALRRSFPLHRGNTRLATMPLVHDTAFLAVWGLQAQVATLALWTLAALIGTWQAVLVMVIWGLVVTHFYETARRHGLEDVMETPRRNIAGRRSGFLSWLIYGLKVYLLGYKQFLYTRIFGPLIRRQAGGWPRKLVITCGLMLFGVTASHHILRLAGLSEGQVYWGNMLARFLQIPSKIGETTVVLSFVLFALRIIPFSEQLQVTGPKVWGIG